MVTLLSAYLLLLALGWEGVACLLMASPLMAILCLFGALGGWYTAGARLPHAPAAVGIAPLLLIFDLVAPGTPPTLSVVSEVSIHAAPDQVWRHVVSFPAIDAPPEPIFALAAMPLAATIDGAGVGALRRCIFTTGVFEEPIEVWRPGRELTFGVRAQPHNLDPYLEVTRGRFELIPNSEGTTTLRGTTWYRLRIGPTGYWSAWTQMFLPRHPHARAAAHPARVGEPAGACGGGGDPA